MIITIPVRRKTIRLSDGSDKSVLEVANGFAWVSFDNNTSVANDVGGGRQPISNPLSEISMDWYNRGMIGPSERIQIELEEGPPFRDDEESLVAPFLDQIV